MIFNRYSPNRRMDAMLWGTLACGVIVAGAHTTQKSAQERPTTTHPVTLAEYNDAADALGLRTSTSLPWWDEHGRYVGVPGDACYGCTVDALGFVRDAHGNRLGTSLHR